MSKLADLMRRASRPETAPIGFAAAAARQKAPTLLCLVRLDGNEAGKAPEAVDKGADAVIVDGLDARKVKDIATKTGESALGVRVQKAGREATASLREAGADFVLFDLQSAMADTLLEEKIGLVLELPVETEDMTLRLLGDLGLEAVVAPSPQSPLTVRQLLDLRRIAVLARTPVLVEVKPDAEASQLQALRESGVTGVIVDWSGAGKLSALKQRIAELPPRGRRREERAEALLPTGVGAGHSPDEHEDDDDD